MISWRPIILRSTVRVFMIFFTDYTVDLNLFSDPLRRDVAMTNNFGAKSPTQLSCRIDIPKHEGGLDG